MVSPECQPAWIFSWQVACKSPMESAMITDDQRSIFPAAQPQALPI
jgi:hypothetical protein